MKTKRDTHVVARLLIRNAAVQNKTIQPKCRHQNQRWSISRNSSLISTSKLMTSRPAWDSLLRNLSPPNATKGSASAHVRCRHHLHKQDLVKLSAYAHRKMLQPSQTRKAVSASILNELATGPNAEDWFPTHAPLTCYTLRTVRKQSMFHLWTLLHATPRSTFNKKSRPRCTPKWVSNGFTSHRLRH